jgi:hypothetical protein
MHFLACGRFLIRAELSCFPRELNTARRKGQSTGLLLSVTLA